MAVNVETFAIQKNGCLAYHSYCKDITLPCETITDIIYYDIYSSTLNFEIIQIHANYKNYAGLLRRYKDFYLFH